MHDATTVTRTTRKRRRMTENAEALQQAIWGEKALWMILIYAHGKTVQDRLARDRVVKFISKPRRDGGRLGPEPRQREERTWDMNMPVPRSMVSQVFAAQWEHRIEALPDE